MLSIVLIVYGAVFLFTGGIFATVAVSDLFEMKRGGARHD